MPYCSHGIALLNDLARNHGLGTSLTTDITNCWKPITAYSGDTLNLYSITFYFQLETHIQKYEIQKCLFRVI